MLDDERGYDHTSRKVGASDLIILQTLVIVPLIFRPRKSVANLHPPVGLGQTFELTLHLIKGHMAVQGYDFQVG